MDNLVKNAYSAYRIDNSHGYGSFISVSGANFSSSEFSLDIWFNITESSNIIISQKNGFSLGTDNDKIIFKHSSIKTLSLKNDLIKIPNNQWNNLYMGYSNGALTFYINGIKFAEANLNTDIRNSEDFILGEEFTGYIRSFRLYNKIISEDNYKNYCFAEKYDAKAMPNTVAFIDCTSKNLPDLSGNNVTASPHEGCALKKLVDVYKPSSGSFAHFADSSHINPGGFSSKEFSVYTKLYIRPSQNQHQIITVNGKYGDSDSVTIFAQKEATGTNFGISFGSEECIFEARAAEYTWVDLIVSLSGTNVTAYINGEKYSKTIKSEFVRTKDGDFKIGGCANAEKNTCEHYLHTIAVFDKVLNQKDATDFMSNHPFVLEDNLIALINFEDHSADELVGGGTIYYDENDLLLAQDTVESLSDQPYEYRVNYTVSSASKMKAWEAELMLDECKSYGSSIYSLCCTANAPAVAALTDYISNNALMRESISDLYMKPTIVQSDVAKSVSSICKSFYKTLFKGLNLNFGAAATAVSAAAAAVGKSAFMDTALKFFSLFMVGSLFVTATAAVVLTAVENARKDKPDDDDDDKDKSVSLNVVSFSLQHSPDNYQVSAIRCRNHSGVIEGTEWTSSKKCINPAVYIADEAKKIKIKTKFKIIDKSEKPKGKYDVSISASVVGGEKRLFDNFKYEGKGLLADKEYEIELESSIDSSVPADFLYSQIELWWSAYVNEEPISLPNTKSDIYIIPTKPCPPILLEKNCSEGLIAVEYLKIFTQMLCKKNKEEYSALGATATFQKLKDTTVLLYTSPYFKYQAGIMKYIKSEPLMAEGKKVGQLLKFKEKEFLTDIDLFETGEAHGKIEIECEVYASILAYYFQALGIQCRLAYVLNPIASAAGAYELLHLQNVYSAGSLTAAQDSDFTYHMIVEVSPQRNLSGIDGVRVFDASMGVMISNRIECLAGYPFYGQNTTLVNKAAEANTYRGLAVRDNTGAIIFSDVFAFVKVNE